MLKIVVIQGHPDPASDRLCNALAASYIEGARSSGHDITLCDIAHLDFPLVRTQADWQSGQPGTPPELVALQQAIIDADRIVLIYPLWFGGMPALLKGFIEQVLRPDVALKYGDGFPKPLLRGKSARVFITMSTPALLYRWYFGSPSLKMIKRHILGFSGVKPIQNSIFGSVDNASRTKVERWLRMVKQFGASRLG
ncbi:MAG: NAD(P)H-dependent oxidoreductase [Paracoccaceae bacterium]|jgi:putative NADPH-quinone reductase